MGAMRTPPSSSRLWGVSAHRPKASSPTEVADDGRPVLLVISENHGHNPANRDTDLLALSGPHTGSGVRGAETPSLCLQGVQDTWTSARLHCRFSRVA